MTFLADNPMQRAPRCKARSKRSGLPCGAPAVKGRHVCRMDGAWGGEPSGSAHGRYRHGLKTRQASESRRQVALLVRASRELISEL